MNEPVCCHRCRTRTFEKQDRRAPLSHSNSCERCVCGPERIQDKTEKRKLTMHNLKAIESCVGSQSRVVLLGYPRPSLAGIGVPGYRLGPTDVR